MKIRVYHLFLIKDQFANYYYGREFMFYRLFKEFHETKDDRKKKILLNQVRFITDVIPALKIHTLIFQFLQTRKDFFVKKGVYHIENKRGWAQLQIFDDKLIIQSTGSLDIELIFMDTLRKTEYNFLALDYENERYGWVKPIKEKNYS